MCDAAAVGAVAVGAAFVLVVEGVVRPLGNHRLFLLLLLVMLVMVLLLVAMVLVVLVRRGRWG